MGFANDKTSSFERDGPQVYFRDGRFSNRVSSAVALNCIPLDVRFVDFPLPCLVVETE